jgi:fibronectin type 3 domain-containing protein
MDSTPPAGIGYIRTVFNGSNPVLTDDEAIIEFQNHIPVPPTSLTVNESPTNNYPVLNWNAVTDADHYVIYRNGAEIGTSITTAFTDNTLTDDGTYHYRVSAVSADGYEGSKSLPATAEYDTTAPTVSDPVFSVNPKQINESSVLTTTVTDAGTGTSRVEYFVGTNDPGLGNATQLTGTGDVYSTTAGTTLAPGTYTYTIRATDALGNWSSAKTIDLLVLFAAPTLSADSPTGDDPVLSWSNVAGADHYVVYRDGAKVGESTTTTFTDTNRPSGTYSYQVTAALATGQEGAISNAVDVRVDKLAPVISQAALDPAAKAAAQTSTLSATVIDTDTSVARVEYFIGTDPGLGNATALTFTNGIYSATIGTNLSAGTYTLNLRATDIVGNWSAITPLSLIVVTPQTPTSLTGPVFTNEAPALSWQAANYADKYFIYRDGVKVGESTSTSFTDESLTAQGEHVYMVSAADNFGDESARSEPITIFYDTIKPTITGTASTNSWTNQNVTVTFSCADTNGSGVVTCPSPVTVSTEGANQSVTRSVTDRAGNVESATVSNINIDRAIPTIDAPLFSINPKETNQTTQVTASAADALSGIQNGEFTIDSNPAITGTLTWDGTKLVGTIGTNLVPGNVYTVTVRSRDNAGNLSAPSSGFLVVYDLAAGQVSGGGKEKPVSGDKLPFTDPQNNAKLDIGFTAAYEPDATIPTGEFNLKFKVNNNNEWNLTGTAYDWLVVPSEILGKIQGTATMTVKENGVSTTTTNKYLIEANEGVHGNPGTASTYKLKIFAPGVTPSSTAPTLYEVSATWSELAIAVGNIPPQQQ